MAAENVIPTDRHGRTVKVGTRVRLLEVPTSLLADLPPDESRTLLFLIGREFEVCEIDERGTAWIEHWSSDPDGVQISHSLALAPVEMEVV